MNSKVLFIVLVGCALVLASPAKRDAEAVKPSQEVTQPTQEEIQKAVENVLVKVGQATREILGELFKQIDQKLNSEDLTKVVQNFKEVLEKAFNDQAEGISPDEEEIQKATNQVIKKLCEAFRGIFGAFLQKIENQANDPELKKAVEELQHLLEKIFGYEHKQVKTRSVLTEEQIEELTEQQYGKFGKDLKDLFQKQFEQMLEKLREDAEQLKKVLEDIFNH